MSSFTANTFSGEKSRHVVRTINKSQALHENSIFNAIRLSTEGAWEAELHFDIERNSISRGGIKTINIVWRATNAESFLKI